jgi:hypothetical protein
MLHNSFVPLQYRNAQWSKAILSIGLVNFNIVPL